MMPLKVEPILKHFGAECSGVDIRATLSSEDLEAITGAMDRYGVCVFRNTGLTDEQHVQFSRHFGYLEKIPVRQGQKLRLPFRELFDASNLTLDGEITRDPRAIEYRKGDRLWHTDSAFMSKRTSYSLLRAHIVPEEGGATWFADTRSAYEDLPQAMKDRLDRMVGINSLWWSRKLAGAQIDEDEIHQSFKAKHPLVHVHQGSGRKALFIAAHTMDIEGLPPEEGRALIRELIDHCTQPQYVFHIHYAPGDLVIWDNLCSMHRGGEFDHQNEKRDMRRTTVREGTEPHTMAEPGDDPFTELFARIPKQVDFGQSHDEG